MRISLLAFYICLTYETDRKWLVFLQNTIRHGDMQCVTYDAIETPRIIKRIISLMGQHTDITFCLNISTQQYHNQNDMVLRIFNF